MTTTVKDTRLHYAQIVGRIDRNGAVYFSDPFNKWLDDLSDEVSAKPYGDITIRMGDRVGGDALIQFGSRV